MVINDGSVHADIQYLVFFPAGIEVTKIGRIKAHCYACTTGNTIDIIITSSLRSVIEIILVINSHCGNRTKYTVTATKFQVIDKGSPLHEFFLRKDPTH